MESTIQKKVLPVTYISRCINFSNSYRQKSVGKKGRILVITNSFMTEVPIIETRQQICSVILRIRSHS